MRGVGVSACLVSAVFCLGAAVAADEKPIAPAGEWVVGFKAEFKDSLGKEWSVLSGNATVAGGALTLKADEDSEAQIMLKEPKFAGSVKMEFDATLTGEKPCDISPVLNASDDGFASGYLCQFGGAENKQNRLRKESEVVESTVCAKPLIVPGKKHHVVAENDNGNIVLSVDGTAVFKYKDASPLKGWMHNGVGLYTFGCTLKIENVIVSKKEVASAEKK